MYCKLVCLFFIFLRKKSKSSMSRIICKEFYSIYRCRDLQLPFDECVKEKIGVERPYIGYFSKRRLYTNDRPEPPPEEIMIKRSATLPPTKEELNERKLQTIFRPKGMFFMNSHGSRVFRDESGEPIQQEKEES